MSEFNFNCPSCEIVLTADESEVGFAISCPGCSSEFSVPEQENQESNSPKNILKTRPDKIPVSSVVILEPHSVVGMVCFSLGTRGAMGEGFMRLKESHLHKLQRNKKLGQLSEGSGVGQFIGSVSMNADGDVGFGGQYGGASFRSDDLEIAFHIAIVQLQLRASYLGANAIVGFNWDVDFDSNSNVLNFIASAYGTAIVK